MLKENANLELLVDDEGKIFATVAGNTVTVDGFYHHLYDITIHRRQEKDKSTAATTSQCLCHSGA